MKKMLAATVILAAVFFCAVLTQCSYAQEFSEKEIMELKVALDASYACRANLRQFDAAIGQWAADNNAAAGGKCYMENLVPVYIKEMPVCHRGGSYQSEGCDPGVFVIGKGATCSVGKTERCGGIPHVMYYNKERNKTELKLSEDVDKLKKENKTIGEYSKMIESDPLSPQAYYNRGLTYAKEHNFEMAKKDLEKAVGLDPSLGTAYFLLGKFYGKDDHEKAMASLAKAIELDPKFARGYLFRGSIYSERKLYDQAIVEYTRVIEMDPDCGDPYYHRGNAFKEKGDYDNALRDYDRQIELTSMGAAYFERGQIYERRGNLELAQKDLEKAGERDVRYRNRVRVGIGISGTSDASVDEPGFFTTVCFINLAPVSNFLQNQNLGFATYGDNMLLYGAAFKRLPGKDGLFVGGILGTTLEGFDLLGPDLLKREREKFGSDPSNKSQFSMLLAKLCIGNRWIVAPIFVDCGLGIGFFGSRIALLGQNSGSFRLVSFLLSPEATIGWEFISLTAGYNYCPNSTWQREAGTVGYPDNFDMSCPYVSLNLNFSVPFISSM